MSPPRVYLDVSCLNRPFDDQNQLRIRLESEAVLSILHTIEMESVVYVSSEMAVREIEANTDSERRNRVNQLHSLAREIFPLSDLLFQRAGEIVKLGIKDADATHLAAAETLGADVFLTCDDRLSRAALRNTNSIHVPVANPLDWSPETHHAADA